MRKLMLAALLATSGMTVMKQPVFAASQEAETSEVDAKMMKELREVEKLFAKGWKPSEVSE